MNVTDIRLNVEEKKTHQEKDRYPVDKKALTGYKNRVGM